MPSIFYSTLRTIILERAISGLFEAVTKSFSSFDLLNGIREFDELHVIKLNYETIPTNRYAIVKNVKITSIIQKYDDIIEISYSVHFPDHSFRSFRHILVTRIIKTIQIDKSYLVVEVDYAKLR